jgi:outer membrane protein assembly factor BamB
MEAGRELWRKRLDVRVFTAPLVAGERVFVLATDRSLHAFDAAEGRALWRNKPAGEPLTLSHPSVLGVQGNVLLAGNGRKLQGLDPDTGKVIWDTALANPRGTNEVERLADLVGPVARVGHVHCARAFQSALACLDGRKGVMLWSRSQSGFSALAADEKAVISVDASSRLVAWKLATGEELWLHDQLLHRELSSPLLWKHRLILGDGNGWVHWLDRDTGKTRARLELGMVPIQVQPVALDGTVLVVDAVGQVSALSE